MAILQGIPWATLAAATAGVSCSIGAGFLVARYAHRRARRSARHRALALESLIQGFLARGRGTRELRLAAREADAVAFWATLETLALGRRRPRWRLLGRALERNPHVRAERRALAEGSPWRRELAARRLALVASPASRPALR